MRIIAGKFKGHQLMPFKGSQIRPTTDRVKESIFNKLMGQIEGAHVLDLFSGTGNLGIEALSRGAERVVCVENHKGSLNIIRENHKKLGVLGEIEVIPLDVLRFLKAFKVSDPKFDVVLIDPPFTKKMAHEVMEQMQKTDCVRSGGTVVIESSAHERIDSEYYGYSLLACKSYGDKNVSFFEKVE